MRHSILLFSVLPYLAAAQPFAQLIGRATAPAGSTMEDDGTAQPSDAYPSDGSAGTGAEPTNQGDAGVGSGYTSENYPSDASSVAEPSQATDAGGCTKTPHCGAQPSAEGSASPTGNTGDQCELNTWNEKSLVQIRQGDVHFQWGVPKEPEKTGTRNVYGPAEKYSFPLWCDVTPLSVYSTASGQEGNCLKSCKLKGFSFSTGGSPVFGLQITAEEPYVQAYDLVGDGGITFAEGSDCGDILPASQWPSSGAANNSVSSEDTASNNIEGSESSASDASKAWDATLVSDSTTTTKVKSNPNPQSTSAEESSNWRYTSVAQITEAPTASPTSSKTTSTHEETTSTTSTPVEKPAETTLEAAKPTDKPKEDTEEAKPTEKPEESAEEDKAEEDPGIRTIHTMSVPS